jgi:hypothetical protein
MVLVFAKSQENLAGVFNGQPFLTKSRRRVRHGNVKSRELGCLAPAAARLSATFH